MSQEFFNNTENSTVKGNTQVSSTRTIIENQQANTGNNNESPNSKKNTKLSTLSEDKNSDPLIFSLDNSSASKSANEKVFSCCVNGKIFSNMIKTFARLRF